MVDILEFLSLGAENARTQKELVKITGLSEREIRAAILHARRKGVPICSGINGYWICATPAEALAYFRAQLARIITGNSALKPIRDFLKRESSRENWEELDALERAFDEAALLKAAGRNNNGHND
ncbi:MAG: hypothetical protein ACI4J7_05620 [Ruminiclostridium sp.]